MLLAYGEDVSKKELIFVISQKIFGTQHLKSQKAFFGFFQIDPQKPLPKVIFGHFWTISNIFLDFFEIKSHKMGFYEVMTSFHAIFMRK